MLAILVSVSSLSPMIEVGTQRTRSRLLVSKPQTTHLYFGMIRRDSIPYKPVWCRETLVHVYLYVLSVRRVNRDRRQDPRRRVESRRSSTNNGELQRFPTCAA